MQNRLEKRTSEELATIAHKRRLSDGREEKAIELMLGRGQPKSIASRIKTTVAKYTWERAQARGLASGNLGHTGPSVLQNGVRLVQARFVQAPASDSENGVGVKID